MKPTKTQYTNGQLECEGFLNGEIQVGNWIFYHENGKIFSKGRFDDNGNPIGIWTEYYDNGQIKYEAISPQGNCFFLDSDNLEIINYWSETGIPLIVNGNGIITTYHDNGNIKGISYWASNLKNGVLQEFYENGQLNIERNYKNGIKEGLGKVFYNNGNPHSEHYYKDGKDVGQYKEWYENGQLSEEGNYIDNEYLLINFWTEDGEQIMKNGTGKAIRKYGSLGLDIYEEYYDKGKMISEKRL